MTEVTTATPAARRNLRGENTRAKLLRAALQAFSTRGFHGTSARDIAEGAGMSPASVYVHYPTKEDLLFQLSLAGHQDVQTVVAQAAARSTEPAVQLREVARLHRVARPMPHDSARRPVRDGSAELTPRRADRRNPERDPAAAPP